MFTKGQRVFSTVHGWGTVQQIGTEQIRVETDQRGLAIFLLDGRYFNKGEICLFHGKPIVSGYEPPPFEGKLKKGEMVLIKRRSDPEYTWYTIKVERETEWHVISETESRFAKSDYILYRVDKEPVY